MLKTIIVDDEPKSKELLRNILKQHCSSIVSIVDEATDVKSGIEKILKHKPDLVFLDINLPDGDGFDIIKKIKNVDFKVIFITAHEEHAVQAIKFSALDFIVKPIVNEELFAAIAKASEVIKSGEYQMKIKTLIDNFNATSLLNKKIVLSTTDSMNIVDVSDINRCESLDNYTLFIIKNGLKLIVHRTLKEYEELLSCYGFFKVHQSHLVNINYIQSFDNKFELLQMKDGSSINVSRRREELLEILRKI
ncbi:MAG: LytTR family DNA-binding domain-containing protein [Bacteroidales bacterium]|jgi:two-component system LytT family response regulator